MKIRLHARAFIGGVLHERGAIVDLPKGVKGPHRAKEIEQADKIDYDPSNGLDANRERRRVEDVALYDVVEEDSK